MKPRLALSCVAIILIGCLLFGCSRDGISAATAEYLYAESPAGEIDSYRIADEGSLILVGKLPAQGAILAQQQHAYWQSYSIWLAVQPGGRFSYSSNPVWYPRSASFELQSYRINPATGALEANPNANPHFKPGGSSGFIPDGRILLLDKTPYGVDSATGHLSRSGQPLSIGQIDAIAFASNGKYAYALNRPASTVITFRILSDGYMEQAGSAPTGGDANSVVADPSGSFAYVTNSADDTTSQYFADPQTGVLRPNPKARTVSLQYGPTSMAVNPSGEFLYVIAWRDESENVPRAAALHRFRIAADGTLETDGSLANLTGDVSANDGLLIDPSGRFLYLRHYVLDDRQGAPLTGFRILPSGNLAPLKSLSILTKDGTVPAISWLGPKPSVRVAARDVAPLAAIKHPLAGSFTEIASGGGMRLLPGATGTVMPDGRVFIMQLVWGKIQAEIYNPKTGRFSPAENVPDQAEAVLLVKLKDNRFMLWRGGKESTVQILDPVTMQLAPKGSLIKKCNNANWVLGDGRVLFHYSPPYRWNACGGEIYDPKTATAIEEPADLQKMDIIAQLSGDKLLVVPRSSLPPEILPWGDDSTVPIPISIYDVAAGTNEPAGSIPMGFLYSDNVLLNDGRLLFLKTFVFHKRANYAELFDPRTKSFKNLGATGFRNAIGFDLAMLADDRVLITTATQAVLFDPITKKFSPTGWMNQNRNGLTFLLHDGNVLFADGSPTLPETSEIYHPAPR